MDGTATRSGRKYTAYSDIGRQWDAKQRKKRKKNKPQRPATRSNPASLEAASAKPAAAAPNRSRLSLKPPPGTRSQPITCLNYGMNRHVLHPNAFFCLNCEWWENAAITGTLRPNMKRHGQKFHCIAKHTNPCFPTTMKRDDFVLGEEDDDLESCSSSNDDSLSISRNSGGSNNSAVNEEADSDQPDQEAPTEGKPTGGGDNGDRTIAQLLESIKAKDARIVLLKSRADHASEVANSFAKPPKMELMVYSQLLAGAVLSMMTKRRGQKGARLQALDSFLETLQTDHQRIAALSFQQLFPRCLLLELH